MRELRTSEALLDELEVEAAWRQEVAARVAALDAGEVETTPWREIRDGLLAKLLTAEGDPDEDSIHQGP